MYNQDELVETPPSVNIPYGYCHCTCGRKTTVSQVNNRRHGWVKGVPKKYILGHSYTRTGPAYLPEDRGHDTPCWIWQAGKDSAGYGSVRDGTRIRKAHAVYWERANGPVPNGMELHHLCRVPCCVNPDHLKPLTRAEHGKTRVGLKPQKTICKHGHTGDDISYRKNGQINCRECSKEHKRKARLRKKFATQ